MQHLACVSARNNTKSYRYNDKFFKKTQSKLATITSRYAKKYDRR